MQSIVNPTEENPKRLKETVHEAEATERDVGSLLSKRVEFGGHNFARNYWIDGPTGTVTPDRASPSGISHPAVVVQTPK